MYIYTFFLDPDQCDPHHKYILIKEDLRIIKDNKLRKLLAKGPNYREPRTINFSKAFIEISTALDKCIETVSLGTKYTTSNFKSWKEKVLAKAKKRKNNKT